MASLQGITLAISSSGIQYFANVLLASNIATALQNLSPPSKSIPIGNIILSSGKYSSTWAENVQVSLSNGKLLGFSPTFQTLSQGSNGQFTMVLQASKFSAAYNWNETYQYQICGILGCRDSGPPTNNNYNYSVGIGSMTITVVFQFAYTNNAWSFTLVSATPDATSLSPNVPSGSVVNDEQVSGCFTTTFSDATKQAVQSIDFSGPINSLLGPLFGRIPSTGQLTSDITFNFPMGPAGLTFPGDSGIVTGVTGDTSYKGAEYPGTNPPTLSVPPVPTNSHLNYYASDYTFNSLFWAFFQAGSLVTTATAGNIPDPAALNTSNYNNTPLQALYTAYPNVPMTASLKALAAPTVMFTSVYDLTPTNITALVNQLPPAVYTQLAGAEGVYMNEASFFASLTNALGVSDAGLYKSVIEAVALVVGAVVTHTNQVVLNVVSNGQTIPVITFDLTETDVLQAFKLGITGTTQTLQFAFQIVPALTKTTFVSSTLQGVNGGDFAFIWNWVLQSVYATVVAKMGQAGVALPRIPGFSFLFDQATITLETGYASVLTDVQHVTDPGVMYLMSKRLIQLGDAVVLPGTRRRMPAAY
ncbi:MAG: hypothetical protein H7319_10250 [Spirosoma sp.]|nr:hypothetical protein [Spirosoma sp.]